MKKSLKRKLIDASAIEREIADLGLSIKEEEIVLLKISTLVENYLLDWILSRLPVVSQKNMADLLLTKGGSKDSLNWLEQEIPNFVKEAKGAVLTYQTNLLTQIRELVSARS